MAPQKNAAFAEESAEVQVLLASLTKTKDLTKRIGASLNRLDASGKIVKDAIGPIYSNTQQLQVTSRNIDRVNEQIEKLRKPLDAKGREEGIIRAGPRNSGLNQYLGALKRVDKALSDLTATNLRSNKQTISEFHSLLSTGVNQLLDLYRSSLQEEDHQVEPLHFLTKGLNFPVFSSEKCSYLSDIANAIVSAGAQSARLGQRDDDQGVNIYADLRGDYLYLSLQNLATASISTSKRGPNDQTVYKPGSNAISTYAQCLENMFLAEFENVSRIFRGETVGRVFAATCSKALNDFGKTLAELNGVIRSRMLTDCFLAYEIIDLITPLSYRLEKRTGQLRPQISDALRPIRDAARSSLTEILSRTRGQAESVTTLPPDGNTIPLVHETAMRIRTLGHFDKPLLHLLTSIGDGGWRGNGPSNASANSLGAGSNGTPQSSTLKLADTAADNPGLLSNYLGDLLDLVLTTLNSRSQGIHKTKPLQAVFMLNTIAVLARTITSTPELQPYLDPSRLETHRKAATSSYMTAWREPSAHLLDTINTTASRPVSGSSSALDSTSIIKSLGSKDKDRIKEKFKLFNAAFDEQVARHKSLYMEREVKTALQRDVQSTIEPLYGRFWDRYHELDKGKGKTVKYSKSELAVVLNSL
ncbi:exocyst complex component exo70 [Knufia obscura]|uniref:Exocyst complex protein EXO70 n=2 Tax=Knufia TaxID=430999 RepID=A0AAN8FHC3_9EURO|nr:exocyst complex component exo70 [Knufia obscura]KAK5958691.1 exocyst complex component exo70 [Knufia fluminis]